MTDPVVAAQMGRPMDGTSRVVSRCALGLPVVLKVHPDMHGRPFPTLYYLVCPLARTRIARLEQAGAVRTLTERVAREADFAAAFAASQATYAAERLRLLPADSAVASRLRGGVGGAEGGVKCLHAHYAHGRAGGVNPVATAIRTQVEPLDCRQPCVTGERRNPAWSEPAPLPPPPRNPK